MSGDMTNDLMVERDLDLGYRIDIRPFEVDGRPLPLDG
jgi:hypothetical protein